MTGSRPDRVTSPAFLELQRLVRHLSDELASFRRRAFQAEARLRELEQALEAAEARTGEPSGAAVQGAAAGEASDASAGFDAGRMAQLERENATLRERLDGASERTRHLLDRVRFLRQQQEQETAR